MTEQFYFLRTHHALTETKNQTKHNYNPNLHPKLNTNLNLPNTNLNQIPNPNFSNLFWFVSVIMSWVLLKMCHGECKTMMVKQQHFCSNI